MGTVTEFIFGGSKITPDGDCSHEIKRCLLLGRKVMTNLDSIFGEGNGTPFQYSCLDNPMDRGAWWAEVHGVTKSRIRLKRLGSSSSIALGQLLGLVSYSSGKRTNKVEK